MGTESAIVADEILAAVVGEDGKWRSGFRGARVDCPVAVAWEMLVDWGNWSWYKSFLSNELLEGESGQPGCLRRLTYTDWHNCERLVDVDADHHLLKFTIEDNNILGGLKDYTSWIKLKELDDGKTMVEYCTYELEPVEGKTAQELCDWVNTLLIGLLGQLEKGAAQSNMTSHPGQLDHVKEASADTQTTQTGLDHVKQASADT